MTKKLPDEKIIAMAVAAIAEETGTKIEKIRVKEFRKVTQSSLDIYLQENNISYRKFTI